MFTAFLSINMFSFLSDLGSTHGCKEQHQKQKSSTYCFPSDMITELVKTNSQVEKYNFRQQLYTDYYIHSIDILLYICGCVNLIVGLQFTK